MQLEVAYLQMGVGSKVKKSKLLFAYKIQKRGKRNEFWREIEISPKR